MPRRFGGPTKARPARRRLRGAACRRPRRLQGRDRLRSVGSVRSQANEARRHAGGRTSGNGPDTTERAPLDARGWVPSVFRARPAIKMQECLLSLFGLGLAAGAGEVQRVARRPARSEYMQPIRCRASRRNRAAERRQPVARPPRPGGRRGRVAGGGNACRPRKLAPTSPGALRPLTTHVAPPGPRQAAQSR